MKLYSILYGNGVDKPLLAEENALFENMEAAVDHADKTLHEVADRHREQPGAENLFALVDEFQGEVRRLSYCPATKVR